MRARKLKVANIIQELWKKKKNVAPTRKTCKYTYFFRILSFNLWTTVILLMRWFTMDWTFVCQRNQQFIHFSTRDRQRRNMIFRMKWFFNNKFGWHWLYEIILHVNRGKRNGWVNIQRFDLHRKFWFTPNSDVTLSRYAKWCRNSCWKRMPSPIELFMPESIILHTPAFEIANQIN